MEENKTFARGCVFPVTATVTTLEMTTGDYIDDCVKECYENKECSAYVNVMPTGSEGFLYCILRTGSVSESDAIPYVPMVWKRDVNEEEVSICGLIKRLYGLNLKGLIFFIQ